MKKILSLFIAIIVAVGMFALPKSPIFAYKKTIPTGVEQITQDNRMMEKVQANRHKAVMQRDFVRPEVGSAKKAPTAMPTKK